MEFGQGVTHTQLIGSGAIPDDPGEPNGAEAKPAMAESQPIH